MSFADELKKTSAAVQESWVNRNADADLRRKRQIQDERSRLLEGWREKAKAAAEKGSNWCDVVGVGFSEGVTAERSGGVLDRTTKTTVAPGCAFDLVVQDLKEAGFKKVEVWSYYNEGSSSWDYDDAGWTHHIRIEW